MPNAFEVLGIYERETKTMRRQKLSFFFFSFFLFPFSFFLFFSFFSVFNFSLNQAQARAPPQLWGMFPPLHGPGLRDHLS